MTPALTVGVPVFNGQRFLGETLDSLLAQTSDDFVVVISDNGSTDATPDICEQYERQSDKVEFHRHPENRGAAWNFNYLIEVARTPFFKWSGSDDICDPEYVERCLRGFDEAPADTVLCYPRSYLLDAGGNTIREYADGMDLRAARPSERLRAMLVHRGLANPVFGVMRTDVLRTTRRIVAYNDSDVVLLVEMCLRGRFHELPDRLFGRRIHAEQAYQANRTAEAVRRWFDPSSRARFLVPRARRFVEAARSIVQAPLSVQERAACLAVLVRCWALRDAYHSVRELQAALRASWSQAVNP
jgi:glycosyltransferase involved in cell wall biosynthesis